MAQVNAPASISPGNGAPPMPKAPYEKMRNGLGMMETSEPTTVDEAVSRTLAPNPQNMSGQRALKLASQPMLDPEVYKTLGRELYEGGKTALGLPGAIYHSVADAPQNDEEKAVAATSATIPGTTIQLPQSAKLFVHRNVKPITNAASDYAAGKVSPEAALDVLPEAIGQAAGNVVGGKALEVGLGGVPDVISSAIEKTAPARNAMARNIVSPMVYEGVGEAAGDARFGIDPARGLVNEGLVGSKEGLAGDVTNRLPGKIDARLGELKSASDNILQNHPNSRLYLDAEPAIDSAIDRAVKSAKDVGAEGTVARLEQLRTALKSRYGRLQGSPFELNELKTRLQNSANELGGYRNVEPADASAAMAMKNAAQNVRQMVDKAVPEAAELNGRMADLIDAKAGLQRKINLAKGEDLFGGRPGTHGGMISRSLQRTIGSAPVRTAMARLLNTGKVKLVPAPTAYVPPPIAGLLRAAPIELRSQMEPIGTPSAPQSALPYQPSLQRPPAFVNPGEIRPAGAAPELLAPNAPADFPAGTFPKQGNLFQLPVEKGFKQTPVSGGSPSAVPDALAAVLEGAGEGGRGGLRLNPTPEQMAARPSSVPAPEYEYRPEGVKQDVGEAVRKEQPPLPRGERRARVRTPEEEATNAAWRQARAELGDDAPSEAIEARVEELKAKPVAKNASGESDASLEALNAVKNDVTKGVKTIRIDTRSGNETPIYGVNTRDVSAGPYETIVRRYPDGTEEILDQGAKARKR